MRSTTTCLTTKASHSIGSKAPLGSPRAHAAGATTTATPDADAGYEAAVDRWDALHASPLLDQAVPRDVVELVGKAQRAVAELARRRPRAAAKALDGISRWCAALRRTAGIETEAPTVQERLEALVDRTRTNDRRLGR